jgi:hypothetical protein
MPSGRAIDATMLERAAPIFVRIRATEANRRARKTLSRIEANDRLQRRARWAAMRAVVEVRKLRTIAGPQLQSMLPTDRKNCLERCKLIEKLLMEIRVRGVR